mmetsp:Transcript_36576/g.80098  ORF Transcript_36576/g.80098 Transcript_36576/m.80098 type:complete len:625 (-) Transcript_36576:69-1943(-)
MPWSHLSSAGTGPREGYREGNWSVSLRVCAALFLAAWSAHAGNVLDNINVDFDSYAPWDRQHNRRVQFWQGNYSDVESMSCARSGDLLFDWPSLKRGMSAFLRDRELEGQLGRKRVMQTYWELIRPVQHSLTNLVTFHNISTSRDCILGMLAVRIFFMTTQSELYVDHEVAEQNNLAIDWHYYAYKFDWRDLVTSGWSSVIWPSLHLVSVTFARTEREAWVDCDQLSGDVSVPGSIEEVVNLGADPRWLLSLQELLDKADASEVQRCPVAFAQAAAAVAFSLPAQASLKYLSLAQGFLRLYHEGNDQTLVKLLRVRWPIWHTLALTAMRLEDEVDVGQAAPSCSLLWCPDGGTPNPTSCACEAIFPEAQRNVTACIFMVDTRRRSSLRNITSILNARFWTLTYAINKLYAEEHGYEIEYIQPDNQTHFPERKVGWGKVKVIIDKLREYGPERCSFGVSIDTDAYFRTSESLAAPIQHYGLLDSKLMLFSQEYHTELRPNNTFINGGFFIVRNTPQGVGLMEEWYRVPEDYPEMAHLKKENPQGLNLCWDEKMHPLHANDVVLAPSYLFTAPMGWFVRHNWFKDLRFEQEMQDVILQRLYRKYNCIMCQNVYDWDDTMNGDVGWR